MTLATSALLAWLLGASQDKVCVSSCRQTNLTCHRSCGGEQGDLRHAECRESCAHELVSCFCECGVEDACNAAPPDRRCKLPVAWHLP